MLVVLYQKWEQEVCGEELEPSLLLQTQRRLSGRMGNGGCKIHKRHCSQKQKRISCWSGELFLWSNAGTSLNCATYNPKAKKPHLYSSLLYYFCNRNNSESSLAIVELNLLFARIGGAGYGCWQPELSNIWGVTCSSLLSYVVPVKNIISNIF